MKNKFYIALLSSLFLTACATTGGNGNTTGGQQNGTSKAVIGGVIGAVAGAVIGGEVDDHGHKTDGRIIGAILGAAAGAGVGNMMDKQEQDFRQTLENERQANQLEIERVREDLLKITLSNEVSFDNASSSIKPAFQNTLDKLADLLNKHNQTHVLIVGHTDSSGDANFNQNLSEQRANAVEGYLTGRGVYSSRIATQGKGETQPRDTNATEAGRQLNRRVEIFVQPQAQ